MLERFEAINAAAEEEQRAIARGDYATARAATRRLLALVEEDAPEHAAHTLEVDQAVLREAAHLPRGHGLFAVGGRVPQVLVQAPEALHPLFRADAQQEANGHADGDGKSVQAATEAGGDLGMSMGRQKSPQK